MNYPQMNQQIHKNHVLQYWNYSTHKAKEFLAEAVHELCTHKFQSDLFIADPNHITLFIDYNLPVLRLTIKFTFSGKHIFFLN